MASASILLQFVRQFSSTRALQGERTMRALRIFMVMTLGAMLTAGLFACGGDGDDGSSSSGNSANYSQYTGTYTLNFTVTDSSDISEIGTTGTWTVDLKVTPYGYATIFYPNSYCGEILSSGIFGGNTVVFRTGADGWNCRGVICCDGQTTINTKFTDANSGTLSRTSTACCSGRWQKSSGTFIRQ